MNKLPIPMIGGLVGGAIGVGVGVLIQKTRKDRSTKNDAVSASPSRQFSPETQDMMQQLEGFKKLPEYHALFDAIGKLEAFEANVRAHPKQFTNAQVTSETSRLVARAQRMLEAMVSKNRNINPLDMRSDADSVKKIIDDLKYNLYQQAGLLASTVATS